MPIVASRGNEIRRLIGDLNDPRKRAGATMRLKALGPRVVSHAAEEVGQLDVDARRSLLSILDGVATADARALRKRLERDSDESEPQGPITARPTKADDPLDQLRRLPPPRPNERASLSRDRGEIHLALARSGSRLARKDLLLGLRSLGPDRARLYCEAAGLIGDAEFLEPLAQLGTARPEALAAIASIAARERITPRSKAVKSLVEPLRVVVARALA